MFGTETCDKSRGQHAEPDQPNAHVTPTDGVDPLQGLQCSFGGDQLTRVRAAGAADLRAGNDNATARFEHLKPFICEKFHTRASFVQVSSIYFFVPNLCFSKYGLHAVCATII